MPGSLVSPGMADDRWWRDPLADVVAGRRVILAGAVAAAWTPTVPLLRDVGATAVTVFATDGAGGGPQPEADEVIVIEPPAGVDGFLPRIRAGLAMLTDPPADAAAALERFDPDDTAVAFGIFLNESPTVAGRTSTSLTTGR